MKLISRGGLLCSVAVLLLTLQAHSDTSAVKTIELITAKIAATTEKVDSMSAVIDAMVNSKKNIDDLEWYNNVIGDYERERQVYESYLQKCIEEKKKLIPYKYGDPSIEVHAFRDPALERIYFEGYNDLAPAVEDTSLWILPAAGIACNTGEERLVYGFVDMHQREKKCRVDFETFSRIGVYSLFPEQLGSIEAIFARNVKIREENLRKCLVSEAHRYNAKVDIVLSYYNWHSANFHRPMLSHGYTMFNMVDSIVSIVTRYGFDGVTVDFDLKNMELEDVMNYKEFISRIGQALHARKKSVNVVLSVEDIYDSTTYCMVPLYASPRSRDARDCEEVKKTGSAGNRIPCCDRDSLYLWKTKLDLFIKPDLCDYLDLILVNMDFTFIAGDNKYKSICPVIGVQDNNDINGIRNFKSDLEKKLGRLDKVVCVVPMYGNVWIQNGDSIGKCCTVMQKNVPDDKKMKAFKDDFVVLAKDSAVFMDDLKNSTMEMKFREILISEERRFAGIGIWNVEYADSALVKTLQKLVREPLLKSLKPRIVIVRYGHFLRRIAGPHRYLLGILLAALIAGCIGLWLYGTLAGREKWFGRYRVPWNVTRIVLLVLSTLYILTVPDSMGKVLLATVSWAIFAGVVIFAVWKVYVFRISRDLP